MKKSLDDLISDIQKDLTAFQKEAANLKKDFDFATTVNNVMDEIGFPVDFDSWPGHERDAYYRGIYEGSLWAVRNSKGKL